MILPVSSASTAYNVGIQDKYVKATALCSCGEHSYTYHIGIFENYCPFCHHYECLEWNPKGTAEGEWTCGHCDSDFCAVDGRCKSGGSGVYLSYYEVPKPVVANNATSAEIAPVQKSHGELMFDRISQYKDVNLLGMSL
ncbi:hypothetical protein [Methanobacterium paludis]|uniref:Uncharacterized protein n=1 Tax=Methanobacterium paludis (strain DSM 25820 / JCM 18151 / SWAN1) TaxID=868131 RepID=F6D2A8_METPW|nr:hypothetical protein [Methanobacterium paludis]AEG18625.1 hypothetical protein MSWAN_1614 [Methanobacterium paludis]